MEIGAALGGMLIEIRKPGREPVTGELISPDAARSLGPQWSCLKPYKL